MANKLAGQRAKFSRAKAIYYSTSDEAERARSVRLMAEVITEAPRRGFTEEQVTQGAEVPEEVRHLRLDGDAAPQETENDEAQIASLRNIVDITDALEIGEGPETVYAYGYACAPDRLKIGSTNGDAVARVAAQIATSTPDRPKIVLLIRTTRSRALERVLHGVLEMRGRRVIGGGAEWFVTTRDEVVEICSDLDLA